MKTRHLLVSLTALVAILITSCSEQQPGAGMEAGGTKTLTFRLTTDGQAQTRAAAPTVTGHKLQYILQVLDAGGTILPSFTQTVETGTFNVTLPLGVAYTCLFWAQYIPDAGSVSEFFDTADLKAVALKKPLTAEDKCQAFCATASVAAADEALTHTVVMKRAVAQVNIKSDTQMAGYSKLTAAYTNVPNTFNVQDNTVTAAGGVSGNANFEIIDFTVSPGADGKYIYQSAYFLASADGTGSMLDIALNTYITAAPGAPFKTITVNNVPTKKNVRTNVLMDFAATSSTYTYTLDFADFDTPDINRRTVSTWDGTYPAVNTSATYSGGDGTQANPYIIGSATDFAQFAKNTTSKNYNDTYFKLDVDINLNNKPWTPTGSFAGAFDGQHHKITGLKVSIADSYVGLFSQIDARSCLNASLSNLHVSGDVENTKISEYDCAGGICGDNATGVIANCSFSGSVRGVGNAGGIAGECNGKITSCKSTASVFGKYAGGIAGKNSSGKCRIYGCYNEGTIETDGGNAGGIYGKDDGFDFDIKGCYNIGTVQGKQGGEALGAITSSSASGSSVMASCYVKEKYAAAHATEETVFGSSDWPTSTNNTVWLAAPDNDGTYTTGSYGVPTGDYKFWKSLGSWNGGAPQYPKLWWEE